MTTSTPGDDDDRTEIIHDVDYPLDVPGISRGDHGPHTTPTTAFPAAGVGGGPRVPETGGVDLGSPLPFGDQPTTIAPTRSDEIGRRGTVDLGLFVLRLAVGVLLVMRGLQKLVGLFDGPGIDGFSQTLADSGFEQARALAIAGSMVELVAGVLLVVGLATPVAAAGLAGVVGMGIAVRLTGPDALPLFGETTRGLETSILYLTILVAVLFTGPGRWSVDRKWGWSYRPRFSGVVWLLIAAVVVGLVWYLLNGTNPLTSPADSAPAPAG